MEILYLWIKSYKGISNLGINLSNQYTFDFDEKTKMLNVTENSDFEKGFWGEQITNLTAIVGRNGVGKTSIIKFIIEYLTDGIKNDHEAIVVSSKDGEIAIYDSTISSTQNKALEVNVKTSHKLYRIGELTSKIHLLYLSNHLDPTSIYSSGYNYEQESFANLYNLSTTFLLSKSPKDPGDPSPNFEPFIKQFRAFAGQELTKILHLVKESTITENDLLSFYSINIPQYLNIKLDDSSLEVYKKIDKTLADKLVQDSTNELEQFVFKYFFINLIFIAKRVTGKKEIEETDKRHQFESNEKYIKRVNEELVIIYQTINKQIEGNKKLDLTEIADLLDLQFNNNSKKYGFYFHHLNICLRFIKSLKNYSINISSDYLSLTLKVSDINKSHITDLVREYFSLQYVDEIASLFLSHKPFGESSLSSGEYMMLSLFGRINSIFEEIIDKPEIEENSSFLMLIDEAELGLHPQWQKNFISNLLDFINKRFVNHSVQILLTSHSPFILSDIPKHCVILLDKNENNVIVIKGLAKSHNTFGTNIHELFTDSFFLQDGLMGEFSRSKINELIKDINEEKEGISFLTFKEKYQKRINIIGEPFLRTKMTELIISKSKNDTQIIDSIIEDRENEIEKLRRLKEGNK